jgi:hypothetical protein
MEPEYGSGANVGGVGIVFILGMLIIVVGIALMIWQSVNVPPSSAARRSARTLRPAPVA